VASILVIDDDPAVLATIKMLLVRDAHAVAVTDDGRKGLELFKTGPFDLLIVDIFMPAMDGLETMNQARRYRPEVPVLVMSGHAKRSVPQSAPDFLQMATRLGAVSSLQKPFRPHDLLAAVNRCLSGQGSPAAPSVPSAVAVAAVAANNPSTG
jgi:CheY-like chemotaxis protein